MNVAPQKTVRRAFDTARIVERKLRLAYGKGNTKLSQSIQDRYKALCLCVQYQKNQNSLTHWSRLFLSAIPKAS